LILQAPRFQPRLLASLKGYNGKRFARDAGAGLTVGIVALPLAMAFAIASGLKPEVGIFTAIVGGLLVSLLGGSSIQIGGPAGAFIVVVADIVQRHGISNLIIATFVAGLFLLIMGMLRMGNLIRLIPVSIVTGFTNGIAVLIVISQLRDFFGLQMLQMPSAFFPKLDALWQARDTVNGHALGLAAIGLMLLALWPKAGSGRYAITRRLAMLPAPVMLLTAGSWLALALDLPVETIGSRFGGIPQSLPPLQLPVIEWASLKDLWAPIVTITLLGAIESLLCARVADNLIHERHDPNQELMAQGIANLTVPLFGGMPVTGTIARTSLNARMGANSPVAGAIHALVLLATVLVAAPLARHVPLCILASILIFMAWNMGEWHEFVRMNTLSFIYRTILLSTFILTVVIDLTVAVEVGLVLACLFFIYRISQLTQLEPRQLSPEDRHLGIRSFHLYGSLFFGAVGKLEALLGDTASPHTTSPVKALVLECHQLISLDTTGVDALRLLAESISAQGGQLILCELNRQPRELIQRSGFALWLGSQYIADSHEDALQKARNLCATPAQTS
jgi:SulP family sulfate permease